MKIVDKVLYGLLVICGILWAVCGFDTYHSIPLCTFSLGFSILSILLYVSEDNRRSAEDQVLNTYKENISLHNKYKKVLDEYEHTLSREVNIQRVLNLLLEGADVEAVNAINEEIKDQGMEIRKDSSGKWVLFISGGE